MTDLLFIVVAGLTAGSIYAMVALGLNITYATTHVFNFAHGDFFMAGGMLGVYLITRMHLAMIPALVLSVLAAALIGILVERIAVRPIIRRQTTHGSGFSAHLGWLLSTFAAAIILQSAFAITLGPRLRSMPSLVPDGGPRVGDVLIGWQRLLMLGTAIALGVGLYLLVSRTLLGRALEAVAQDPDGAEMRGIPVSQLGMIAFAIGVSLAALIGFIAGPVTGVSPTVGLIMLFKGFIAAAVGGIPDLRGALVGGLFLGLVEAASVEWIGAGYRNAAVFALLLVVLTARPSGLLGARAVRVV